MEINCTNALIFKLKCSNVVTSRVVGHSHCYKFFCTSTYIVQHNVQRERAKEIREFCSFFLCMAFPSLQQVHCNEEKLTLKMSDFASPTRKDPHNDDQKKKKKKKKKKRKVSLSLFSLRVVVLAPPPRSSARSSTDGQTDGGCEQSTAAIVVVEGRKLSSSSFSFEEIKKRSPVWSIIS